jgi:PIN domain nuclease of toxin-antitoxin system
LNLLLDTHAFIWATALPERLSPRIRALLGSTGNTIRVSTATIWEISLKHGLQRKDFQFPEDAVVKGIQSLGSEVLPVEARHALALFRLPNLHRDPFDRILIAQAWTDNLRLVTVDQRLKECTEVETVW